MTSHYKVAPARLSTKNWIASELASALATERVTNCCDCNSQQRCNSKAARLEGCIDCARVQTQTKINEIEFAGARCLDSAQIVYSRALF